MKDEIKEFNEEKYVEMLEDGTLYDYITNLQERNNNLKEDFKRHIDRINELTERSDNLQEEYEKVHKDFAELSERYFFIKSRNEKAIEYIEEQIKGYQDDFDRVEEESWLYDLKITLNILKGDNK